MTQSLLEDSMAPETEIIHSDGLYEIWYNYPDMTIITKEEKQYACKYSVSEPLSDNDFTTLIRGLYENETP